VSDLKKIADDLVTDAALAAGKDRARRALEELTLSDEEKALRDKKRARAQRLFKVKLLAGGVLALLLVVWVFAHLWTWLFGLALLLGIGVPLYFFARGKVRALGQKKPARVAVEPVVEKPRIAAQSSAADAAAEAQEIDDELAALKERTRK
jgi:Flp pilus assembly protein TadB